MDTRKDFTLYLFFLTLILFLPGLGTRDFWAPVEPRYGEIARVMFARNEWIVPTVNGDLYTDKPVAYFWLVLLASNFAGAVNEWTVRLPPALGGVGLVLTTYYFGRDFFSARVGFLSAVVLATCMRVIWEARWAHVDALFCFFFALSVYFAARSLLHKGSPNEVLLGYVFMGLATLTKGLIGVVLPALLITAYVVARREWRAVGAAKLHLGIPIFLIIAAPWFYLVNQATDGKWLHDFIYIHHLQRYSAGAGHRQPLYYYLTTLPVDFLPWTVFLVAALSARPDLRKAWRDPATQFFLLWFLVVLVFFSLSDTKRDLYLLPLLPPLALFIGNYFDALAAGRLPQDALYTWLTSSYFGLVAIAGLALPVIAWFIRRDAVGAIVPASAVLAAGGVCAMAFIQRRRPLMAFASVSVMMTVTILATSLWIFPYLERFKSPRLFSLEINKIVPASTPLYIYADTMNDFNYYLEREVIPILSSPAAVGALLAREQNGYMLIKERDLKRVPSLLREWIVVSEADGTSTWYLIELRQRWQNSARKRNHMMANRALIKSIAWISGGVIAVGLTWSAVSHFFGAKVDPRSEQHLSEIAAAINRSVPVMIDKETELMPAEGHYGMLIYKYRLVGYSVSQLDHEKFAAGAKQKVAQGACNRPETRDDFLKNGVTLRYSYFDKDKKHIATVDVTPADCEKIPVDPPLCENCFRITKETFGCPSKAAFDKIVSFAAQGDNEAAAKGITAWCEMLNEGDIVYLDSSSSGVRQIRRKGSTQSLWIMSEMVGK